MIDFMLTSICKHRRRKTSTLPKRLSKNHRSKKKKKNAKQKVAKPIKRCNTRAQEGNEMKMNRKRKNERATRKGGMPKINACHLPKLYE